MHTATVFRPPPIITPKLRSPLTPSQIQFTATDLYDKEKVDIEHVVMEEVFQLLQCDEGGLTDAEAQNRVGIFGPNKLEEKSEKYVILRHHRHTPLITPLF